MKGKFTKIMAALALLVGLTIPMGLWGQTLSFAPDQTTTGSNSSNYVSTETEFTTGNVTFKINNWNPTSLQIRGNQTTQQNLQSGSNFYLHNTTAMPGNITGITITYTAGTIVAANTYAMTDDNAITSQSTSNSTAGTAASGSVTWTFDGSSPFFAIGMVKGATSGTTTCGTITITYTSGGQTLDPCDLTLTGAPITLTFDLYNNSSAQSISFSTSSTGAVTVDENDYVETEIDNNTITVTPIAVTNGNKTITVRQAADATYAAGTATFTVNITDSTPFAGGDVTFKASEDKDLNNTTQGEGSITKNGVTFACSDGILGNGSEYRLYKNSTTSFSATEGTITQIVFTQSGNYAISNLTPNVGNLSEGTWTGNASTVSFTAGAQARASQIVVTVNMSGTPDPVISAENVSIEYNAESGVITYIVNNEVEGGVLIAATESDWLTLGVVGDNIPFTCTANEAGAERTAMVTLTYTFNRETVTKDVTVTQAGNPNATMTIAEVREQGTGSVVTEGVVTSCVGTTGYIQDATAAICVYGEELNVGDEIKVSGTLTTYKGLLELTNPVVTVLSQNNTVEPEEMNIATINANANTNQGWYVRIEEATIIEIGSNSNYTIAQGENTITLHGDLGDVEVSVNDIISVSGNIGCYNTVQIVNPQNVEVLVVPSITIDPVTVEVDAEEHDGTLTVNYLNLGDEITAEVVLCDIEGSIAIYDWFSAELNEDNNVYYIINANDGEARTAYFKVYALDSNSNDVYSNIVTVSQAAYVAPVEPGNWVLTDLADLTAGDVFVIVGTYNVDGSSYAMANDKGTSSAPTAVEVTIAENTLAGDISENIQWNISGDAEVGYTFYPAGSANTWLYCTNSNNGVRVGTNSNNIFVMEDGYLKNDATSRYVGIYDSQDWRCYTSINNNIADQTFAFYKKVSDDVTYTKTVAAYEGDGGYVLIASPVCSVAPSADNGFLTGEYDLYAFDQAQEQEWRNYKASNFNLVSGKGYMYASSSATTLTFTGQPYNGNGVISLDYTEDVPFAGWNLVGNPYAVAATPNKPYYRLNDAGSEVSASTESSAVNAMEGVFVVATEAGQTVSFSTTPSGKGESIALNVMKNRGTVIDRAIVRFDEGGQLPKFQLFENSTKLYIPQGNSDYAIVRSAAEGEMPVNFKAKENGTYTISVNTENVEMDYLHLIDNMTGNDVDLLATPSYTFEATTRDYASRFRLVFNANDNNAEGNANFAYFNGSEWQINNIGEATLQVVDVMGRIVKNVALEGNATVSINEMPGVYMMRLLNGNDVKVQKVVIR